MTVSEYCRHETGVRELVIIRKGGWTCCAAYIDHEDLFRLPGDLARAEMILGSIVDAPWLVVLGIVLTVLVIVFFLIRINRESKR